MRQRHLGELSFYFESLKQRERPERKKNKRWNS